MHLVKVISLSWFHVKSLIKSLIFKIFFSAWSGRLAQKQAQSMPVRHSIRATDWDCDKPNLAQLNLTVFYPLSPKEKSRNTMPERCSSMAGSVLAATDP